MSEREKYEKARSMGAFDGTFEKWLEIRAGGYGPIEPPQPEREHKFKSWMVKWIYGISPSDEVYDQLNAAWNQSGSCLRFSAWLTEQIAIAIQDILGGPEE